MGTYDASKYVTARKAFRCADCQRQEQADMRYLAYKPGLKSTVKVCYDCSLKVVDSATGKRAKWWCQAAEEEIAKIKRKAAEPFTSIVQLGR